MAQRDQRDLGGEFVIALVALAMLVFAVIFGILLTLWSQNSAGDPDITPTTEVAQVYETISVTQPTTPAPTEASPDVIATDEAAITAEVTAEITRQATAEPATATATIVLEVFTLPATPTPTLTDTATEAASATSTLTNTVPPTDTATARPSATSTLTPTFTLTATATVTPSVTASPEPTATNVPRIPPTATSSATPRPSPTVVPSDTATSTPQPTSTATVTMTSTARPSATPTLSPTSTWTPTLRPSATASLTPTDTPMPTDTATLSPTDTDTPQPSETSTATSTATFTSTPVPATLTPTLTATSTPMLEPTAPATMPPLPTLETPTPCTPPTDWILYTARFGETFDLLSTAVDTPVETLLAANCLPDNGAALLAGDAVYLPVLPRAERPPEREAVIGCVDPETAYFENLEPGAVLEGEVTLTGSADAVNFWYAKIELRPVDEHGYRFVTRVQRSVTEGDLATIDAGDFTPGDYWLRLVVYNLRSQVPLTGVCVVPVTIRAVEEDNG